MSNKISIICNGSKNTFIELVKSIEDSISDISDYKTHWLSLKDRKIPYGDINIIVYGRYIAPTKNSFNILIQTEQKKSNQKNGFLLNDYNVVLNLFPNKEGIYLPLGYSKYFDNSLEVNEDVDFLFFGGKSNRRLNLIKKYNIYYKQIIFNNERNELIQRAKWNVNIKSEDNWNYTPLRGILIMSKGKILFQEEINDRNGYGYHNPYLIKFNQNNLLEVSEKWNSFKKRKEFGMYVKESLMKKPFKEIFLKKLKNVGIK